MKNYKAYIHPIVMWFSCIHLCDCLIYSNNHVEWLRTEGQGGGTSPNIQVKGRGFVARRATPPPPHRLPKLSNLRCYYSFQCSQCLFNLKFIHDCCCRQPSIPPILKMLKKEDLWIFETAMTSPIYNSKYNCICPCVCIFNCTCICFVFV